MAGDRLLWQSRSVESPDARVRVAGDDGAATWRRRHRWRRSLGLTRPREILSGRVGRVGGWRAGEDRMDGRTCASSRSQVQGGRGALQMRQHLDASRELVVRKVAQKETVHGTHLSGQGTGKLVA